MKLTTILKRLILFFAAITIGAPYSANASTWNSGGVNGNAAWTSNAIPGWNGTGVPNSASAMADFTGIIVPSTATTAATTTVGTVIYGGNTGVTATIAGTNLTLDNGGAGVLISNSSTSTANTNKLVISAPLVFGNPNESVTISNTSASGLIGSAGAIALNTVISGTTSQLIVESNSMDVSVRLVASSPGNSFVATNGILYRSGYINTAAGQTSLGGAITNVITIGELGAGDVFLASGNSGTIANPIIVAEGTDEFRGFRSSTTSLATFSGAVTLDGDFAVASSSTGGNSVHFTHPSGISGQGGLNINPTTDFEFFAPTTGIVRLSAANTYTGDTTVNAGTLNLSHQLAVQNSTVSTISHGLLFSSTVVTNAFTFGGLAGSGNVALQNNAGSPAAIALSVGNNNANTTYSGVLSANGSLAKIGAGVTTLSNANTYTGATTVSNGVLQIASSGSINSTSGVTINGGELNYNSSTALTQPITFTSGTISGTGAINVPVTVASGSTLSPGNSPGAQAYGSGLTWTGSGDYNWQILDASGTSGIGYDVLNVTGILDVSGALGFDLNLWSLSSIGPDVNGDAINWDNTISHSWVLATTTGGVSGFDALNFNINVGANNGAGGFSNDLGGGSFSLALANGGNDLVLTFTPVPEPNAFIIFGISLVAMCAYIRHQKHLA